MSEADRAAEAAYELLDGAIQEHRPSHVFALFSGGHDSVCSTYVAAQHPRFSGVVHVNTGIGIEETRGYVRDLCRTRGWPLLDLHPPDWTYRDMVLNEGFPGPAAHGYAYSWLKERALAKLVREHKSGTHDRIALVTGIRKQESQRRSISAKVQPVWRQKARLWIAPLFDWQAVHRLPFMAAHGLPRNRVADILHFSGECLCGAMKKQQERGLLKAFFPAAERQISDLEAEAAAAGTPCKWGERPPRWWLAKKRGQLALWNDLRPGPLCAGCDGGGEQEAHGDADGG